MMYIVLTDQELDALQGRDYVLTALYIYLKKFMDYNTGMVGLQRRISYQSISEALYIEPRAGVKGGSPHISAIRRMIDQLLNSGIVKKGKAPLVFKLPYAQVENYAQNKADRKSTPQADTDKANTDKAHSTKADRPKKVKADTPHYSLNTINKPPSLHNQDSSNQQPKADDDENLIFHKSLHADITAAMTKQLDGFNQERKQEIIDELSFYISKNRISVSPMSLFLAMVKGAKAGTFIAANANQIRRAREAVKAQPVEKPKTEQTAEQREINKEKGREAMSNVKQLFNKKGKVA